MTKQLKKKIEGMVELPIYRKFESMEKAEIVKMNVVEGLLSLCKEYALSVLPKEKKVKFNTDIGFNQAIKQSKENIK